MTCEQLFQQLAAGALLDEQALASGLVDTCRNSIGHGLIHCCKTIDQLRQIAAHATNIDQQGAAGTSPLMAYADRGIPEFCQFLLAQGAKPNLLDASSSNALHGARSAEMVDVLVAAGVNMEVVNTVGRTPYLEAALFHRLEVMRALAEHGANLRAVDNRGCSALHFAAQGDCCEGIDFCLEHGSDLNETAKDMQTALHFSVCYDRLAASKLLMERGCSPNLRDSHGRLPLDYVKPRSFELRDYLLAHGAKFTFRAPFAGDCQQFSQLVLARLEKRGTRATAKPCQENEIKQLEQDRGIVLPAIYRSFLLTCGHGAQGLFDETNWMIDELDYLSESCRLFCEEDEVASPPHGAFVFLGYRGENFWYFDPAESDNPKVIFIDGDGPLATELSLADFVLRWEE
jgi:SMI1 / KNR4 family (SUKH-1)/Ankyrin repeats (3 copies)